MESLPLKTAEPLAPGSPAPGGGGGDAAGRPAVGLVAKGLRFKVLDRPPIFEAILLGFQARAQAPGRGRLGAGAMAAGRGPRRGRRVRPRASRGVAGRPD
jgi:hypothetical protein